MKGPQPGLFPLSEPAACAHGDQSETQPTHLGRAQRGVAEDESQRDVGNGSERPTASPGQQTGKKEAAAEGYGHDGGEILEVRQIGRPQDAKGGHGHNQSGHERDLTARNIWDATSSGRLSQNSSGLGIAEMKGCRNGPAGPRPPNLWGSPRRR